MYGHFACIYVSELYVFMVPKEARKKALDSLELESKTVVAGCWELKPGPLEE